MDNNNIVQSIFTKNHYINPISCVIIWFGGILFIYKHLDERGLIIFFYTLTFCLVIILIGRTENYYKNFLTKNALFLAMLIITAAAILLNRLGYIGYPSIAGFSILWLLIIYYSQNVKMSLIQIAVFLLSPVLYSELISFSGIFALAMLVVLSIFISERFLESKKLDWKFFLVAFLFGVTLVANIFAGFVYIIYLLFLFRNNIRNGAIFILTMLAAYAMLLFLRDKEYITIVASYDNLLQSVPVWIVIFLVIASFYIGWIVADLQEVFFTGGLIYFILFTISFLLKITQSGWKIEVIDLSLMIVAIPFLVLSIKEYKVDRFWGKVLA